MPTPFFLDTNILIYAFEPDHPEKMKKARQLIHDTLPWVISWQVVQEFCSVSLHRFKIPLTNSYLETLVELLLTPHCKVYPDAALVI